MNLDEVNPPGLVNNLADISEAEFVFELTDGGGRIRGLLLLVFCAIISPGDLNLSASFLLRKEGRVLSCFTID